MLVLCYNVAFAAKLRAALADCANVHVCHFEGWAKQNHVVRERRRGTPLEPLESLGQRLHLSLERGEGDARRFDAVLIDEAQDFEANWFRCAVAAMKDPLEGDLLLVGDGNQGLYRRGEFRWSDVGVQARGRTISARFQLDRNYRNTREIAELAALFGAAPTANGHAEEEGIPALTADPGKCLRSGGQRPVLVRAQDRVDECARVLKIVEDLRAGKWFGETIPAPAPEEIGVLYRAMCPAKEKLFRRFLSALGRIAPTVWLTEPGCPQARERVGEKAVMVQTIHSAKGLQYKAVVLLWADDLPAAYGDTTPEAERRLLYVAFTRAEDWLALTSSNPSGFVEEVQRSGRAALL